MEIAQKEQGATLAIAIWGLTDISRAALLCPTLTCRCACVCVCFPCIIKEQLVACGAPVECMCVSARRGRVTGGSSQQETHQLVPI